MKGLLTKDFMISKRSLAMFAAIVGILFVISLLFSDTNLLSGTMPSFLMAYFTIFLSITLFSYDEVSKWNLYALTLPISKQLLVAGRYLYLFLALLAGMVISVVFSALSGTLLQLEFLLTLLGSAAASLLLVSILLPLLYRFGPQTARILMMVIFMGTFLLAGLFFKNASLPTLLTSVQTVTAIVLGALAFSVVLFVLSYLLSCKFMEQKDLP